MTLFYTKDVSEFEDGLIDCLLDCAVPLPAKQQKETFTSLVSEALGEEADLEVVKNIHENLEQIIEEKKQESPAPVMLDKTEMKDLLEKVVLKKKSLRISRSTLRWLPVNMESLLHQMFHLVRNLK